MDLKAGTEGKVLIIFVDRILKIKFDKFSQPLFYKKKDLAKSYPLVVKKKLKKTRNRVIYGSVFYTVPFFTMQNRFYIINHEFLVSSF